METKRCIGCGQVKALDLFYRNKKAKDGRTSRCKPCTLVKKREWAAANRHKDKEYSRRYRARNPGLKREQRRRERQETPEKYSARQALRYALKTGRVVRPDACEDCGKKCKPQAHHPDYSRKLDVRWLCQPCHAAEHKREAEAEAAEPAPAHTEEKGEGRGC